MACSLNTTTTVLFAKLVYEILLLFSLVQIFQHILLSTSTLWPSCCNSLQSITQSLEIIINNWKNEIESCKLCWIAFKILFDNLQIYLVEDIEFFYGNTAFRN